MAESWQRIDQISAGTTMVKDRSKLSRIDPLPREVGNDFVFMGSKAEGFSRIRSRS
jgi:hypothetical protein